MIESTGKSKFDLPFNLLSSTTVLENVSNSSVVATISAIDNEISDVHTFSLIDSNDSSDDDNASFTISGTSLVINSSPDYETKASYNIYDKLGM